MIKTFLAIMPKLTLYLIILSIISFFIALFYIGTSPLDYQQGILVKILYLHVPCAWLSLLCYVAMAFFALAFLFTNNSFYGSALISMAPIGANFTALTLFCGAVWGSKSWGTWWAWDARLISELLLLFIYLAIIALHKNFNETQQADFAASILCLLGSINIPIIKFSVIWWNSLHQNATITMANNNIDALMLKALFSSAIFLCFTMSILFLLNLKLELLKRAIKLREQQKVRLLYKKNLREVRAA